MKNLDKGIVMLVLCRRFMADLLTEAFKKRKRIQAFGVYEFSKAKNMALVRKPDIAVVEIPERYGNPGQDTLDVCKDIKEASPGCIIMLICPENDEKSVEACIEAKRHGKIEDYVFYDSTVDYLASKLEALRPPGNSEQHSAQVIT